MEGKEALRERRGGERGVRRDRRDGSSGWWCERNLKEW